MKLHFLGGVREVTGSRHLLETGGISFLLDCGLFQGHREETRLKNEKFPFSPREIDALILSHAHIDHSGNIPTLVKQGFKGDIYATFATRDLSMAMLRDSAKIQEKDAEFLNTKRGESVEPLYTLSEVDMAAEKFSSFNYHKPFEVAANIKVQFFEAGHVLGAALSLLTIKEKGKEIKIGYLVDLGRKRLPILRDPELINGLDYIIMESTYGNRVHQDISEARRDLGEVVRRTYERGGKIIIPAFALERTQELVYYLHKLHLEKKIPKLPIYVDSPLAVNITEIFRLHPECFDKEINEVFAREEDPFGFGGLVYIREVEKSKALNDDPRPAIIISASGMCENGRILHHLKNNIEDERNTILIVGFMARHTLGRRIMEREKEVRIFNRLYKLKAEVVVMDSFSAHADQQDILNYLSKVSPGVKGVFFVHGEENESLTIAELVKEKMGLNTMVPQPGEVVEL